MTTFRFFIALFVLFESSVAQNAVGTVAGSVTDLDTHEALIGANVVLKSPGGKDLPYGAAADISGRFFIPNVPAGDYVLRVSYIGYQAFDSPSFTLKADSTYRIAIRLDPYSGKTAEDAHEDIRKGIIRIYMWSSMIAPTKAHTLLAEEYGFEIGNTGCMPMQTERYDSVMIQHLASRNGGGWFKRFMKEWNKIKW